MFIFSNTPFLSLSLTHTHTHTHSLSLAHTLPLTNWLIHMDTHFLFCYASTVSCIHLSTAGRSQLSFNEDKDYRAKPLDQWFLRFHPGRPHRAQYEMGQSESRIWSVLNLQLSWNGELEIPCVCVCVCSKLFKIYQMTLSGLDGKQIQSNIFWMKLIGCVHSLQGTIQSWVWETMSG